MNKKPEKINFGAGLTDFNYKKLGNRYLLVNFWGDHVFLNKDEFAALAAGKADKKSGYWRELEEKNFVRRKLDISGLTGRYHRKKSYLFGGPGLHIMVVTLRCDRHCLYCGASARGEKEPGFDMSEETARRALDIVFRTTNNYVSIEFQGGEPLLNWPVVRFIIEEASRRNRQAGKELDFRLVTNGSRMTPAIFSYLARHGASICFSLDGPAWLHRSQRGGDLAAFRRMTGLIEKFNKKAPAGKKQKRKINARLTVTRLSLPYWKEIVDEYRRIGLNDFYFCPVNPFGFSAANWKKIGFTPEEFLKFYRSAMDYAIGLNLRDMEAGGKNILRERMAATFMQKIAGETDPNHLDYRSPCGAGIGQLAYHYNGDVYTCDEGRMLAETGIDAFRLGNAEENNYEELVTGPVVKTMCAASCAEALPDCGECVYRPYCGVCPVYNYACHGNIFAPEPNNERCRINKGVLDYLFEKLADPEVRRALEGWIK